jgi:23S rRNA pseudouridine2605 synthase
MEKRRSQGPFKKKAAGNTYNKSSGRKFAGPGGKFPKRGEDGDAADRPFKKRAGNDDKPFKKKFDSSDKPGKKFDRPYKKREDSDERPGKKFDRPYKKREDSDDRPGKKFDRPYKKREDSDDRPGKKFDRPYKKREDSDERPDKKFDKPFKRKFDGEEKPAKKFDKPYKKREGFDERSGGKFDKPFRKKFDKEDKPAGKFGDKAVKRSAKPLKEKKFGDDIFKPEPKKDKVEKIVSELEGFTKSLEEDNPIRGFIANAKQERKPKGKKKFDDDRAKKKFEQMDIEDEQDMDDDVEEVVEKKSGDLMPLNKYIAHSGECSRRDAAELVKKGKVKVNGELVMDPGHKVVPSDLVTLSGKKLKLQKNLVYVLLNKPKDYITTTDDPEGRKTVMDLLTDIEDERVYPVGRLDRHTSGLLLLTNDGDLAQKLSHPSYMMKKVYHVTLDKPLTKAHFDQIMEGVELEDGKTQVDQMAYLEKKDEIGLEIHSGKNRIVRRIFESLGYTVEKLDRVMYAGLTKKNLPRGKWRFLTDREIIHLKHFKSQ